MLQPTKPAGAATKPSTRLDESRRTNLVDLCEFILSRLDLRGRYVPPESLLLESIGYRSSLGGYLAEAGRILGEPRYVEAAGRILRDVLTERIGDMVPVGAYLEFPIYRGLEVGWRDRLTVKPDLRYTAITVLGLGLYYRASGDASAIDPARRALAAILNDWDFARELPRRDWLIFELLGMAISIWEEVLPEFRRHKEPLLREVLDTFVTLAPQGFAFLTMYRTIFIINETGAEHLYSHIKPGIDAVLAEQKWRCPESPDDFYHIEKTGDHVNVRGNGAVAIMLRLFDWAAGRTVYTDGAIYRHVANWMDGQRREDGAYYGCREFAPGPALPAFMGVRPERRSRRYSMGSPDQYLPIMWMIGGAAGNR